MNMIENKDGTYSTGVDYGLYSARAEIIIIKELNRVLQELLTDLEDD